jgi:hypothetical protein
VNLEKKAKAVWPSFFPFQSFFPTHHLVSHRLSEVSRPLLLDFPEAFFPAASPKTLVGQSRGLLEFFSRSAGVALQELNS